MAILSLRWASASSKECQNQIWTVLCFTQWVFLLFTESDDNYSVAQSKSASEGGGSESESRKSSLDKPTSRFTSVPVAEPTADAVVTMTEPPSGAAAAPSRFTQTRVIEDAGVGLTPLPGTKGLNRNGFSKGQSGTRTEQLCYIYF